jgi:hypothetical protein
MESRETAVHAQLVTGMPYRTGLSWQDCIDIQLFAVSHCFAVLARLKIALLWHTAKLK